MGTRHGVGAPTGTESAQHQSMKALAATTRSQIPPATPVDTQLSDMLKIQDNPPMRLETATSVCDYDGPWWVAHTKSRHEKALAWDLHRAGVGYYLPMLMRETISGGRKRRQLQPLFTSYMFFCGGELERHEVMKTHRVANILPVPEREPFLAELSAIECAIDSGRVLRLYQTFHAGERCRVKRGPMAGHEGTVVRVDGVERVVLYISILGRGAELEIHGDHLERLDGGVHEQS